MLAEETVLEKSLAPRVKQSRKEPELKFNSETISDHLSSLLSVSLGTFSIRDKPSFYITFEFHNY